MRDKTMDEPDEYEKRAIARHPLTQRLNHELLESFSRNSRLKAHHRSVSGRKPLETKVFAITFNPLGGGHLS